MHENLFREALKMIREQETCIPKLLKYAKKIDLKLIGVRDSLGASKYAHKTHNKNFQV